MHNIFLQYFSSCLLGVFLRPKCSSGGLLHGTFSATRLRVSRVQPPPVATRCPPGAGRAWRPASRPRAWWRVSSTCRTPPAPSPVIRRRRRRRRRRGNRPPCPLHYAAAVGADFTAAPRPDDSRRGAYRCAPTARASVRACVRAAVGTYGRRLCAWQRPQQVQQRSGGDASKSLSR